MTVLTLLAAYPLGWPEGWPRTEEYRRSAGRQFQCSAQTALTDLAAALSGLGTTHATLSSWLPVSKLGGPRLDMASNRLPDPGVCVLFVRHGREYVMARDAFTTPGANIRSIGLALDGLRRLERHGGGSILDRAFAGFAALPPPDAPPVVKSWREVLGLEGMTGPAFAILAGAEAAYRALARRAHPDNGGSTAAMAVLNNAIDEARRELAS